MFGHWAAMWEVVSLTPAELTLRVLKELRKKYCLCNYTHKCRLCNFRRADCAIRKANYAINDVNYAIFLRAILSLCYKVLG